MGDRFAELAHAYNQLPPLTDNEVIILQLSYMLRDSRPRSADQVGAILVTEGGFQQRPARLFDPEVR
jgi:hypothetical protein